MLSYKKRNLIPFNVLARSCRVLCTNRRSISRWIVILWGKRYIQQWHRGSMRRIGVSCLGLQCFHWTWVHGGDICLGIRRWLLVPMVEWRRIRLFGCTNIGCMVRWIRDSMASRLGSKLIRLNIGGSSVGCIGCSSSIRSFHQLFLCTRS